MKSNIPTIALVGRPNVGKSTLFNRLIKKNQAIVSEKSGTTRDRNMSKSFWLDKEFNIYDTGGYSDELGNDAIQEEINFQVEEAMSVSDIIVFLVSAKDGVTNEDRQIASLLRNTKKNVIVAVNKSDNLSDRETQTFFYELGFSNLVSISALHGTGTGELYDEIIKGIDWNNIKAESEAIKFALFGKQNVGKSTLTNAILGEERMIVSSIPGTTRDPINIPFMYKQTKFNI
ncbi:MAG: GTP-binding protein, partial [Mycoplasmataceae bacterium]|nr:GTP-binding protein [Mycoplasmataceae bacterium]